jgi:glutamine synthetase
MTHFLEYIWVDKSGIPRSKIRTSSNEPLIYMDHQFENPQNFLSNWNFDGSSTGQNWLCPSPTDTEVVLKPVRAYTSPLDKNTVLVLCQLDLDYSTDSAILQGPPIPGFNTRSWAARVDTKYGEQKVWFGAEQEYFVLDPEAKNAGNYPYNWFRHGCQEQGNFYCSVGYPESQVSDMTREHMQLCASMGIKISGINCEVAPSQWEFQVGPDNLLKVADDLVMARYILLRLSTKYKVKISFHPKPMKGDLFNMNGSGCHLNFSTLEMRTPPSSESESESESASRMDLIHATIDNLAKDHPNILKYYGEDNHERLTGLHETSSMEKFSYGVGTRHTSVRIPNQVAKQKYGYIEDRRPASNIDPYLAMGKLLLTSQTGSSEE